MSKDEFLYRAFLVFGICGMTNALLGMDHFWKYFGFEELINLSVGMAAFPPHSGTSAVFYRS